MAVDLDVFQIGAGVCDYDVGLDIVADGDFLDVFGFSYFLGHGHGGHETGDVAVLNYQSVFVGVYGHYDAD